MTILAIIPARSGSKRIPNKNIKDFFGKPIISYPIETAQASKLFDEIMVSTDNKIIAEIAIEYGASVPFLRGSASSTDFASTTDVLIEVLEQYHYRGSTFDLICCIYPTSALITKEDLTRAYAYMFDKKSDSLITVQQYLHPPQRGCKIDSDGNLAMVHPEFVKVRTQDLDSIYHDAGQFYLIKSDVLMRERTLFTKKTSPYILDELHAQDVDEPADWMLLEMKYRLQALIE